jgi:hypothetical protein
MATSEGTQKYLSNFSNIKSKILGKTGLQASICGFGCYRIDDEVIQHQTALEKALTSGINLIDTSSNYSDGGSEIAVGKVLNKLFSESKLNRNEIIVVSKVGYLQGSNLKRAIEREQGGKAFKDVIQCSPDLRHCISEDFLENQITLSLKRLRLENIDIYLLHNPEYFLTYSLISDPERRKREYYRRIKDAFIHLEKEVKLGRISYYGISSNTFGSKKDDSNFTSLEKVVEIANEVSEHNHFGVVQLPMNIFESGGINNFNQYDGTKTFLQLAAENNLGVLVNRPLNAINKNKLFRLADYPVTENRADKEILSLIEDLEQQELMLINKYINFMELNPTEKENLRKSISVSQILKTNYTKFNNPGSFNEIKTNYLIPCANYAVTQIGKSYGGDENILRSLRNYAVTTNIVIDSIFSNLAQKKNTENKPIHEVFNKYLSVEQKNLSLSQKITLLINSLPQVSTTLVGMKNIRYVDDVINCIKSDLVPRYMDFWHDVGYIYQKDI